MMLHHPLVKANKKGTGRGNNLARKKVVLPPKKNSFNKNNRMMQNVKKALLKTGISDKNLRAIMLIFKQGEIALTNGGGEKKVCQC